MNGLVRSEMILAFAPFSSLLQVINLVVHLWTRVYLNRRSKGITLPTSQPLTPRMLRVGEPPALSTAVPDRSCIRRSDDLRGSAAPSRIPRHFATGRDRWRCLCPDPPISEFKIRSRSLGSRLIHLDCAFAVCQIGYGSPASRLMASACAVSRITATSIVTRYSGLEMIPSETIIVVAPAGG